MNGRNLFCNHYFSNLLLLAILPFVSSCVSSQYKEFPLLNNEFFPELPQWVFHNKIMKKIPAHQSQILFINNTRILIANSTSAMGDIVSFTGCLNGGKAVKLLSHKMVSLQDTWMIQCNKDHTFFNEKIIFNLSSNENKQEIYKSKIKPEMRKASLMYQKGEKKRAVMTFELLLELEPSLPEARFHAGMYWLSKKNCVKSIPHLVYFLRIFPSYPEKKELVRRVESTCGNLL